MGIYRQRMTRRSILAGGGALGGLAVLGTPSLALGAEATAAASNGAFEDLAGRLRGPVVTPGDADYDAARHVWNGMIDKRPAAIARCSGVADVIDVVNYARSKGLPATVRGGGHNVAGKAVRNDALTIDLSSMNHVHVDPDARRARAGGGSVWGSLDRETLAFNLVTTGGTVSSTGVGGLTLGGGLGWLMRKHGLACDNLVSADVVTADGRFLTASADENSDLYWALRGGGGNFGVVTSFEFALHPLEPVIGGIAIYPQARLRELLEFYRDYTAELPDSVTTMAGALNGPPGTPVAGQSAGWLAVCHAGPESEGNRLLQPIRDFGEPALGGFGPMPYSALQGMFDAGTGPGGRNYWRSNFMTRLPDEVIDIVVDHAEDGLRGAGTLVLMEHMGGAVGRVGATATAFSNRGADYNVSILSRWSDAADDPANIRWTRSFGDAVKAYSTGAGYINYMTEDEGTARVQAAYQANLDRLIEVKRKYDPDNFFNANQNIAP